MQGTSVTSTTSLITVFSLRRPSNQPHPHRIRPRYPTRAPHAPAPSASLTRLGHPTRTSRRASNAGYTCRRWGILWRARVADVAYGRGAPRDPARRHGKGVGGLRAQGL
ncbi:hypothetical protein BRADI_2g17236v3 [Brachypodium distachyon]|uniref:Uncharacterized protein n=1 Tax=Brachypodium distachyon TaxID=15368 RepID=A0A2K2D905_BRADI|nr:hypothetical protein BRADI_2g17236v3 [Brachypodium distachyon]